jgi:mono/diheme cytochrome c family protein
MKQQMQRWKLPIVGIGMLWLLITGCTPSEDTAYIAPAVADSETYMVGQQVYANHCAECHGENGEGQFPEAPMQPDDTGRIGAPPHNSSGHTWHHGDDLLVRYVIEGGLGDPARFYPMPALGDVLTDEEVTAVIAYIKTLWSPEEQAVQRERTLAERR